MRSSGWTVIQETWCLYKKRRSGHTQGGDGYQQAKERGLRGNQPCPQLDLRLPASQVWGDTFLLFNKLPGHGALWRQASKQGHNAFICRPCRDLSRAPPAPWQPRAGTPPHLEDGSPGANLVPESAGQPQSDRIHSWFLHPLLCVIIIAPRFLCFFWGGGRSWFVACSCFVFCLLFRSTQNLWLAGAFCPQDLV